MARQGCEDKSRVMVSSSSAGFPYTDHVPPTHILNQIQGFVSDPDMFNLTTNMEMIGFDKNQLHQQQQCDSTNMWRSNNFYSKPGASNSNKTMYESSTIFCEANNNKQDFTSRISETTSSENLIIGTTTHEDSAPWQENRLMVDDSSLRCVFPCEGNERPSQGLSLSLSSTNPSSIGVQSFELRHTTQHHEQPQPDLGFFGKSDNVQQQHQQQILQDEYLSAKAASVYQGHFFIKNSKYLVPAQELLNEFCSLGAKQSEMVIKQNFKKNKQLEEEDHNNSIGSTKKRNFNSLEFVELQKRRTKLLSMLEEVDRRYKHYRSQMKAVVSSFETVAGNGAATVYSALALKAMSRHFRCLKDVILGQIQVTRKNMGEKDPVAAGRRGETPRLKVIDQALRQQRAFQQISMMETHPWRPQRGLPERSVSVLRAWLFQHFLHPYPSDVDKHILSRQTGLSRSQVSNWFINARVRLWKPMVEEMYLEEVKDHENNMANSSEDCTDHDLDPEDHINPNNVQNPLPSSLYEDQKPSTRIDSKCAPSIINNHNPDGNKNNPAKNNHHHMNHLRIIGPNSNDTFGSMGFDFSPYSHRSYTTSNDQNANHGVSLTLGLQQHGERGVGLALRSATHQSSLFYLRDHIEDCHTVQYSLLDDDGQNLQLLHDLEG